MASEPGSDPLARLEELESALTTELAQREPSGGEEGVPSAQLTRLLEVARAMSRTHDRDELLTYVNERLRELFDAQNAFVILFDQRGAPVVQASYPPGVGAGALPVSETLLQRVRESREPVVIDDTAEDVALRDQSSIARLRIASVLCAPLIVEDEVIGVLQFDQRGDPDPFSASDLRLLTLFADQVAASLYNLRLIEQKAEAVRVMRETQSQLVQAERLSALGEMAGGIAHNFNNTLFVALGLCDVLLAREDLDPEARGAVRRIRTCSLDAANTVRRLQAFARGEKDEDDATFVLSEVVEDMAEITRHKWEDEAGERGVRIQFLSHLGKTPPARGRAAEIREVITNLIFNAVEAMDQDGTIEVTTGTEGPNACFRIRDDGAGMDAATRRHVFEPFFTTKGARGHGFGLSSCWSIVRRMGGKLDVARSAPGQGSEFVLILPPATTERERPVVDSPRARTRARVLLVDDEEDVLEVTTELLEALGHEVVALRDAREALELLDRDRFDLVLSDVGMPELSGGDVVRAVRERAPEVPVVLLTGWGAHVELDADVEEWVSGVLAKPVTVVELDAAVAAATSESARDSVTDAPQDT